MVKTQNPAPFRNDRLAPVLKTASRLLRSACGISCGRDALEQVRLPEGVGEVSMRARRLMRQSQISPW